MQGVEVFESVGAAAKELKPKDAIVRDAASAAPHAALTVASAEGLKPTKFMRNNLVKQSGVPGVLWNSTCFAWEVQIPKYDSEGKRKGKTNRKFSVKKFMVNGRSEAEADAAALEAAKTFRAELVRSGIVKESKELDPNFTSDVPGVLWSKEKKKWRVEITLKRSNPKEQWSDLGLTVCTLHLESQIGPLLRNKGTNYVFVLLAAYHLMTHANTFSQPSISAAPLRRFDLSQLLHFPGIRRTIAQTSGRMSEETDWAGTQDDSQRSTPRYQALNQALVQLSEGLSRLVQPLEEMLVAMLELIPIKTSQ